MHPSPKLPELVDLKTSQHLCGTFSLSFLLDVQVGVVYMGLQFWGEVQTRGGTLELINTEHI